MRAHPAALGLLSLLAVAGLLRLARAAARWDEIALAYAAYTEPAVRALLEGRPLAAASSWVGLHPPLHAVMMGLVEVIWPAPAAWLALSALASLGAVLLLGRAAGPWAAAALAWGPLQLAYAAEVNNYPLAVLAVAALLAAPRRPSPGLWLALGLACWAHVLTALAAGALVARLLLAGGLARGQQLRLAAGSVLLVAPVVTGALVRVGGEGTFVQARPDWATWWETAVRGVGPEGLLLAGLGALGLFLCRGRALLLGLVLSGGYLAALLTGAAATHQRPYLALLGPVLAVGLSAWPRLRGGARLPALLFLGGLLAVQLGRQGGQALGQVAALRESTGHDRGIALVLAEAGEGDTLWLVAPALYPDDDKTAVSPVLWRLSPLARAPLARPVSFEYLDYRYGQPRAWPGLTVHTSVELEAQVFDHVARAALDGGHRVWVVLYEHAPATGLAERVARVLRPYEQQVRRVAFPHVEGRLGAEGLGGSPTLGEDLVYELRGLR